MFLKWDDSVFTIVCLHPGDLVVSRSEKKFKRSILFMNGDLTWTILQNASVIDCSKRILNSKRI